MSTFAELVVMDQFGVRPLCPASWGWKDFFGENAHGNRDGDAFGIDMPKFAPILPLETGARKRRVRQPGDRDVVEDVVARKAAGRLPVNERRATVLLAERVVIRVVRSLERKLERKVRSSTSRIAANR